MRRPKLVTGESVKNVKKRTGLKADGGPGAVSVKRVRCGSKAGSGCEEVAGQRSVRRWPGPLSEVARGETRAPAPAASSACF